ncbi:MAG: arginyl-tRNA synthetase [Salinibacterium sp.]|nr:arginyl-tRNA synthetase [Salinibacterium sp.]
MRVRPAVLFAPLLVILLAGCFPTPEPIATPTASPSPSASVTATPTPTPTPTATPDPAAIPLDIACDALISAQAFYDFNPNYSLLNNFTPDAGTPAAAAVAAKGVACRWVNQSSGVTIDISAARLPEPKLSQTKDAAAAAGTPVSEFSAEGYFSSGTAQAFTGDAWITAVSPTFLGASDAASLINEAIAAVG